jgi:hypothetical protein
MNRRVGSLPAFGNSRDDCSTISFAIDKIGPPKRDLDQDSVEPQSMNRA